MKGPAFFLKNGNILRFPFYVNMLIKHFEYSIKTVYTMGKVVWGGNELRGAREGKARGRGGRRGPATAAISADIQTDPTGAGWSEPILARSSCVSFGSSFCCASYRKEWILIPWDRSKDLDETTSKEPEGLNLLAGTVVISKISNNGKKTSWARARGGRYSVHLS